MRKSKRQFQHYLTLIAAIMLASSSAPAGETVWTDALTGTADALVREVVTGKPAGNTIVARSVNVAAGCDGNLFYTAAMGDADPGVPASPATRYQIGSISKQFSAAALFNLIDAGARTSGGGERITLETRLSSILPESSVWDHGELPPITLRRLLSMTSSLPNFTRKPPSDLDPWGAVTPSRLRNALTEFRRRGSPTAFEYSNTGYFLLAEVIEAAGGGRTYRDIMRSTVFDKAGLEDAGFTGEPALRNLARPHYNRRPAFTAPDWLKGSADIVSSASDLFKWNTALMGGRVLSPSMSAEMFSDAARVDVWTYYGAGWFINHRDGRDTYFHSGTVPGYTGFNLISRDPEKLNWCSVSILTNSDGVEGLDELADRLIELAFGLNQ